MHYCERPPPPSLAKVVRCIWMFDASADEGEGEIQRVVADGCPEMVLHYGDHCHEIAPDGALQKQAPFIFAGQLSQPLLLKPGANAGMIGIRLQPAGARMFVGMAMREATDMRIDLTMVWNDCAALIDAVGNAGSRAGRFDLTEKFLIAKLAASRSLRDLAIERGVALLEASEGRISVDDLAEECGLSARQLERRFLGEVGLPPRLLASIFRFRRVFDLLENNNPWATAAIDAGYFDQPHMIRDFKRFAGQQPQAFYRGLKGLSAAMIGGENAKL